MKYEVSDELYFATASPITEAGKTGKANYENAIYYFFVNPIMGKKRIGRPKVIGYVEAISGITLFNTKLQYNKKTGNDDVVNYDYKDPRLEVGCVDWKVSELPARKILKQNIIDKYFEQSIDEICMRIEYARYYCQTYKKEDKSEKSLSLR